MVLKWFISDCKLGFISDDDSLLVEELGQVNIFCDSRNVTIQSVIGLNFIDSYHIYFSNDKMRMTLYR
jgi:hypothetical protein